MRILLLTQVLAGAATCARAQALPPDVVYLRAVDPTIQQDIRYAGYDNFFGRPLPGYDAPECILMREAAAALKRVQADLAASGLGLKVYDCYRPARAVRAMVQWVLDGGPGNPRFFPRVAKRTLLAGYIATRSKHSTATTIDLTLVEDGRPTGTSFDPHAKYGPCTGPAEQRSPDNSLDMGTGYDCFDPNSYTNSPAINADQRRRRILLQSAMAKRGFRNYSHEWWHFTFTGVRAVAVYDFPIPKFAIGR